MIEPSDLAALICATVITVTVGAVLLLGPLARQLPALLEKMIEQRQDRPARGAARTRHPHDPGRR